MIREIINFVTDLERDYPEVFDLNKKPSPGLHLWVELDEDGNWNNNPPVEGKDYVVYDGKEKVPFEKSKEILKFERTQDRVTGNKWKSFDSTQKISSSSPFAFSFNLNLAPTLMKKKNIPLNPKGDDIKKMINLKWSFVIDAKANFFSNSRKLILNENDEQNHKKSKEFEAAIDKVLAFIKTFKYQNELFIYSPIKKNAIHIYLRDKEIPLHVQNEMHDNFIMDKDSVFSKKDYTISIDKNFLGVPDFMTSFPEDKKPFMLHQTSFFDKKINTRITVEDAWKLKKFGELKKDKRLPNPLPIFIDKDEFKTESEIIRIYNEDGSIHKYRDLIKAFYKKHDKRVLANYYLVNIAGGIVLDFDFVSLFRYKLNDISIKNLFASDIQLNSTGKIDNVFQLEQIFDKLFFKINNKTKKQSGFLISGYFGKKIESGKPFKGHTVDSAVLANFYKYRKAIYDWIYKSKQQTLNTNIFDEITLSAITCDIKLDEYSQKRNSNRIYILEKLNIWFSLKNTFNNNSQKIIDMANKLSEHRDMIRRLISDDYQLQNDSDFAFASGQIVCYLFSKGAGADKSYSRLEPFMQKSNSKEFVNAIVRLFDMYKHESFSSNFNKVSANVFDYKTEADLKQVLPDFLAGFFDKNQLFSNSKTNN